jgi:tetratricopeptide (TPR) repeat protein
MLVFAIWAVNLAYNSYMTAQTSDKARAYYQQGNEAYGIGNKEAAIGQWRNAERVSPHSDYAALARDAIFKSLTETARESYLRREYSSQIDVAKQLIESRPTSPEGYYYAGLAYEAQGDPRNAAQQYDLAIRYGGNDQYAIDARQRLDRIGPINPSVEPGQPEPTKPPPSPSGATDNIPFESAQ